MGRRREKGRDGGRPDERPAEHSGAVWQERSAILRAVRRLRGLSGGIRGDALWLFGTQLVALLVTFVATPIQLDSMGPERYGVVVVLSVGAGYAGLLDLGVAWAVMRYVPWYRERGDDRSAQRIVGGAVVVAAAIGVLGGALVFALAAPLAGLLDVSSGTADETTRAVRIAALLVPIVLLMSVCSGLGRAVGMFPLVGLVSAGQVAALNVVWAVVGGSHEDVLKILLAQVVIGSVAIAGSAAVIAARRSWVRRIRLPRRSNLRELLTFGWKTSAGQAGIGLVTAADKPVLGSLMPVAALTAYAIPFSLASRIGLISSSVSSAVFPPLVAALARDDAAEFARLRQRAFAVVGTISGVLALNCVFAGRPLLEWWLGAEAAADSWVPLAVLGVGFGAMACGSIGNILLDASGRPGLGALIMVTGGATGLVLAAVGAAVFDSAAAASAGAAIGLATIGVGGVEFARRMVVAERRRATARAILSIWPATAAIAALLRVGSEVADLPAVVTMALVAAGSSAVAAVLYRRSATMLRAATSRSTLTDGRTQTDGL